MNQVTIETNVVETEIDQITEAGQSQDAIAELNSTQLALVGGGGVAVVF